MDNKIRHFSWVSANPNNKGRTAEGAREREKREENAKK